MWKKSSPGSRIPSIDAQQAYWNDRWRTQRSPNAWQRRRAEAVVTLAQELHLQEPRILDLGCGTGFASRMLDQLGPTEGIDLSPAAIAIARAANPGMTFRAGDLFDMALDNEHYDLVVCQEVIPHVADQQKLIDVIADMLVPRGHLIITAANKFVMSRLDRGSGPIGCGPLDPEEHIKRWLSLGELKALLRPRFEPLKSTSTIVLGQQGILRLINSYKLNAALSHVVSQEALDRLKEKLGWGYTLITVARKR